MSLMTIYMDLIIFAGIILMLVSIIRLIKLFKGLYETILTKNIPIYTMFRVHLILLVFFLVGYIVVFVSIKLNVHYVGTLFVSLIFLFGAIFVLIGLILQSALLKDMRKSNLQAIKVLASAAEARDPYTMGHSEHVANLLGVMYDSLPWRLKKNINYDLLKYAGLLHDIGKIGVPENILNNPGQLSDSDMDIMKQHPSIGESIINHVEFLKPIARWILYHHERIDGKGYNNLKGEEIPFVSKMMAVADTYSSLVTERKYRPVKSHEEAVQILNEVSGFQLDKEIVNIFCNISYDVIKNCVPKNQSVRLLYDNDDINESNFEYVMPINRENILDKDTGIILVKKQMNLANRNNEKLIFNKMIIEGLREDKDTDYHVTDRISIFIEEIINKRIRKSDIVSRLSRNTYLFLFQKCSKKKANEILNSIENKIKELKILSDYGKDIKFTNHYIEYNPKNDVSSDFFKDINLILF